MVAGVERVSSATDVMNSLREDLLELSRIGRLPEIPEKLTLTQVAEAARELVAGDIESTSTEVSIDPDLPPIVGLFERLDPQEPGTGIGLTIVRRVVELHRGHVWLESEGAGCGATFFFTQSDLPELQAQTA